MKMSIYTVAFYALVAINLVCDYQMSVAKEDAKYWKIAAQQWQQQAESCTKEREEDAKVYHGNVSQGMALDIRLSSIESKIDRLLPQIPPGSRLH